MYINNSCVNCLRRRVQAENSHFKCCMSWMQSTFLGMRRPHVKVLSQYVLLKLAKGRRFNFLLLLFALNYGS